MRAITYDIKPLGWATCLWLKRFWPGCLLTGLNGLRCGEIDTPELPGDDWVLVETLLGGICGTDLSLIAQGQPPNSILQGFSSMPVLLGHENVAVVRQVGPDVDDAWIGKEVPFVLSDAADLTRLRSQRVWAAKDGPGAWLTHGKAPAPVQIADDDGTDDLLVDDITQIAGEPA